jgi:hypothetical protein
MPQVYNGGQSPLEYYAINGRPEYAGSGRIALLSTTFIGTTKYAFQGPYKNPIISGSQNTKYSVTHTNAVSDSLSPYNGKGTGNQIDMNNTYNGVTARVNYNGGSVEDRLGVASQPGSGRSPQIVNNAALWGYGPAVIAGGNYIAPNMSQNIGQVVI